MCTAVPYIIGFAQGTELLVSPALHWNSELRGIWSRTQKIYRSSQFKLTEHGCNTVGMAASCYIYPTVVFTVYSIAISTNGSLGNLYQEDVFLIYILVWPSC